MRASANSSGLASWCPSNVEVVTGLKLKDRAIGACLLPHAMHGPALLPAGSFFKLAACNVSVCFRDFHRGQIDVRT